MSKLSEIFNRALSPFTNNSNSQQVYNDLKEGKKISLNMNSDRYTYDNREDNKKLVIDMVTNMLKKIV